jgi:outer membrane autotransporter protein
MGPATAAPPRARPFGFWAQGFADRELRDSNLGLADGRIADTGGVIGGLDYTMLGARDAFLFGVLSGYTDAHIRQRATGAKTELNGASVGIYGVYVRGGFSIDFNSKVDFFEVDQDASPSTDLRNYVTAGNLNYKIYGTGGVWIEPTAGVIYTVSRWGDNFSALDGHTLRVQGGARVGTSFVWHGVTIEPTLTGLLYSDVDIHAGSVGVTTGLSLPTDEGRVFKQGILRFNFDYGGGLSTSIEGEVRHGDLAENADMLGFAGRLGLRYQW